VAGEAGDAVVDVEDEDSGPAEERRVGYVRKTGITVDQREEEREEGEENEETHHHSCTRGVKILYGNATHQQQSVKRTERKTHRSVRR
jgi:hypothetical protein